MYLAKSFGKVDPTATKFHTWENQPRTKYSQMIVNCFSKLFNMVHLQYLKFKKNGESVS